MNPTTRLRPWRISLGAVMVVVALAALALGGLKKLRYIEHDAVPLAIALLLRQILWLALFSLAIVLPMLLLYATADPTVFASIRRLWEGRRGQTEQDRDDESTD